MRWKRYDRQGFTVVYFEDGDGWYWRVSHPKYGVHFGRASGKRDAYLWTRYAIGNMRQGVSP